MTPLFRLDHPTAMPLDISISPNSTGLPGISQLRHIAGASTTIRLVLAVLALIISAIVWRSGRNLPTRTSPGRGKLGVLVALGAAGVCGASVTLVKSFWNLGQPVD